MAAWMKPNYKIKKEFHSTFDPFKHESHAPFSPLYRPGQEQHQVRERNDDHQRVEQFPSLPLNDDYNNDIGNYGHQKVEDQTPRLNIDPRFGSAQSNREPPGSPMANQLQGRDSKMSMESKDTQNGAPYSFRDEYLRFRANNKYDQPKPPVNGGTGYGSYTDRSQQKKYPAEPVPKPWAQKHYYSSNDKIVDPRIGSMAYGDLPVSTRLRHGGALLFIRFPTGSGPGKNENIAVAAQAFLRSKTHDMGGKFLGLARLVEDFGYPDGPREAMGVYHFPSPEKAKLFFQYDNYIRQPDFPPPYGHAEMWIVSNAYLPDNLDAYNTFVLSEIMLHEGREKREFFEVFQTPFEGYLSKNGVMPFVVCSYGAHDRQSLRRHAYPRQSIVTCHLFQGYEHLNWLCDQEMYLKYRSLHNQMAEEKCMVFSLDRNPCL